VISYLFAICIILHFIVMIYLAYIIFKNGPQVETEDEIEEVDNEIRPYWETYTNPYPGYFEDINRNWW